MWKCYWHFPFFGGNKGKVLRLWTIWFLFRGILIFLEVIMYGLWGQRRTNDTIVKLKPCNQKESLYGCRALFSLPLFLKLLKALTTLSTFQEKWNISKCLLISRGEFGICLTPSCYCQWVWNYFILDGSCPPPHVFFLSPLWKPLVCELVWRF